MLLPDLWRRAACSSVLSRLLLGLGEQVVLVLAPLSVRTREEAVEEAGDDVISDVVEKADDNGRSAVVGVVGVVDAGEDVDAWLPAEWWSWCKQKSGNSSLHPTLPGRLAPDSGRAP